MREVVGRDGKTFHLFWIVLRLNPILFIARSSIITKSKGRRRRRRRKTPWNEETKKNELKQRKAYSCSLCSVIRHWIIYSDSFFFHCSFTVLHHKMIFFYFVFSLNIVVRKLSCFNVIVRCRFCPCFMCMQKDKALRRCSHSHRNVNIDSAAQLRPFH